MASGTDCVLLMSQDLGKDSGKPNKIAIAQNGRKVLTDNVFRSNEIRIMDVEIYRIWAAKRARAKPMMGST